MITNFPFGKLTNCHMQRNVIVLTTRGGCCACGGVVEATLGGNRIRWDDRPSFGTEQGSLQKAKGEHADTGSLDYWFFAFVERISMPRHRKRLFHG